MRRALLVAVALLAPVSLRAQRSLKVYISADMEGVAGLSATNDPLGRQLMTAEVNAAIAGAFDAGAAEVVVNDAHGGHDNVIQDRLDPRVTLLRGDLKPYGMVQGLDGTFDAAVFVGYHEKAGGAGFLAHTGSGRTADLRVNGRSVGEAGMNAYYAAWFDVPVVFLSGDSLAVEELQALVPGLQGVAVKSSIWGRAVRSLSPDSATQRIRDGVRSALEDRSRWGTPVLRAPFRVEYTYAQRLHADIAEGIPGIERIGDRTVAFETAEYPPAYRFIRFLYKHLQP